uniref:Sterile alpha motif domain containing 1a n=1 Tax=Takifugu rubripes TaxID=31033 RepID=H2U637_TAKRU
MSESKYREWILDTIDSLRSRKARPDLDRICRMVRRRHGSEPDRTCAELEKLIQEQTVLKVNYKGSISYRNAAKVQRRSRKKDDVTLPAARRSTLEEASHSDLSNGDSAVGPADQDEEDLEADTSMAMDTDSNVEEEAAEESRDGQEGPSPCSTYEEASTRCPSVQAVSAPSSPPGSQPGPVPGLGPDPVSLQKAECQHPGMQRDKAATKPLMQPVTVTPGATKNNTKTDDGGKAKEIGPSSDQLVPDYAAGLPDETKNVSDGKQQALPLPSENCTFNSKVELPPLTAAENNLLNGDNGDDVSVKKEMSQNLLQWTVADVASYFSAAGFPEQAVAFRAQEIDGKSLLLMQRSDVLTGLSIRLGPALKIYERHVKVLQRTHFLEYEDV